MHDLIKLSIPEHLSMFDMFAIITLAGHVNASRFRTHEIGTILCEGINGKEVHLMEVTEQLGLFYPVAEFGILDVLGLMEKNDVM